MQMGILTGCLSLLCVCLLIAKALTRKYRLVKAEMALLKIHKLLCAVLIVSSLFHLMFVLPLVGARSTLTFVTGISAALILALIVICRCAGRKARTQWLRLHRVLAGIMLFCVAGHMAAYFIDFYDYQSKVRSIRLSGISTDGIEDGQYTGECDVGYIYAKVEITIFDGKIENIRLLEHRNERGQDAEKLASDIADTGRFPVDAVSGATNSSIVIQKAIQNALESHVDAPAKE